MSPAPLLAVMLRAAAGSVGTLIRCSPLPASTWTR
jgi:hypothetical protein